MYRVEMWTVGDRGVSTQEAATKKEANFIASQMRGNQNCLQTVVIFPNDKIRVCRNPKAKMGK